MMLSKELQAILVVALTLLSSCSALPARKANLQMPAPALSPPPRRHFRRGLQADATVYAPAFLPTPLPPLDTDYRASRGQPLRQPKKPVYHYTPIKPFTLEDLGNTYRGKGAVSGSRSRLGYEHSRPLSGPPVHEPTTEIPPLARPIIPPTPIKVEAPVRVSPAVQVNQGVQVRPAVQVRPSVQVRLPGDGLYGAVPLVPEAQVLDIKNIRLGEAFVADQPTSGVVQKQNPSQGKYHFEYRVRDRDGEFGHAEARDGPLTSGGYDVNLRKTHVQSVRYLVDSKEIPRYGYAHL